MSDITRGRWHSAPPLPRLGSSGLLSRLTAALAYLEHIGIRVPTNGRARRAARLLEQLGDDREAIEAGNLAQLKRIEAAHRTAWEVSLIAYARYVATRGANPFPNDRLQIMMRGAELPERVGTQARDAQFEMYIAAMLRLGGADVRRGEPDLRILFGPERVGIAAKRVSSREPSQVRRHLKKAAEQILAARLRGFIAINLDSRFLEMALPRSEPDRIAAFEGVFDELASYEESLRQQDHVLGLMVYGYLAEWTFEESSLPELKYVSPFRWYGWTDDVAGKLLFDHFTSSWRERVDAHLQAFLTWRDLV